MTYESLCPDCGRNHKVRNAKVPGTPRQAQILRIIRMYRDSFGYGPTLQEIADKLEISKVTVFLHIEPMKRARLVIDRKGQAKADRRARTKRSGMKPRQRRWARTLDIAPNVVIPTGGKP